MEKFNKYIFIIRLMLWLIMEFVLFNFCASKIIGRTQTFEITEL